MPRQAADIEVAMRDPAANEYLVEQILVDRLPALDHSPQRFVPGFPYGYNASREFQLLIYRKFYLVNICFT